MKKSAIFIFVIFRAVLPNYLSKREIIVKVSEEIGRRYFIGCSELLYVHVDDKSDNDVLKIGKIMMSSADRQGCVVLKSFQKYLNSLNKITTQDRCSRVLNILYGEETRLKEIFTEVSFKAKMKGPVWLIFLDRESSPAEFLENANVPFDVDLVIAQILENNTVELQEAYRVSLRHPVRVKRFGYWEEKNIPDKFNLESPPHVSLYYRRDDLEGLNFRVGTKDNPPMSYLLRNGNKITGIGGYLGQIWIELQKSLNFTSTYCLGEETGIKNKTNGEWNGLIGQIVRKEIDVGVLDFTIAPDRYEVMDFLRPLISTRNQIYFKKAGMLIRWDSILRPFHHSIWLTIPCWILVASIALMVFLRLGEKYNLESASCVTFSFENCLMTSFRALCQQGSHTVPKSSPCRAIFFSSYLVATVLLTAYSGALTSYITVQSPRRPFKDLRELLHDGTYKVEPVIDSAAFAYFANANDSLLMEVYNKLIAVIPKSQLPKTRKEALEHVCFKYKVAHFGAMFMTDPVMEELNKDLGCDIISLEHPLDSIFVSIGTSRSNQYTDALNHHLDMMGYKGHIYRLKKLFWPTMDRHKDSIFKEVEATQVIQIHLVLIIGIIVSSAIFIGEKFYNKWKFEKNFEKFYFLKKSDHHENYSSD